MKLKRRDLRDLSLLRIREAEILLRNHCWEGAYYLAGYAVECGLKACVAKSTGRFDFPDLDRVRSTYTHDLGKLVTVAGLDGPLKDARKKQPLLAADWPVVKEWSEQSRYERKTEAQARTLLRAVSDRQYGFLRWLETHW